ncbi:phosphate ABC transporter substrate-binding protein PstS [soil metagenome]
MIRRSVARTLLLVAGLCSFAACEAGGGAVSGEPAAELDARPAGMVTLTGAGATFPYPIYSRWFNFYAREHPVRVNYQSIGSGGGIRQITEGTVDFGASDAPMTDEALERAGYPLNLPTVLGAVAITYNLPGFQYTLNLDGSAVAEIFLGEITRWNDPRIARLNPGVPLPDQDLLVVHRSDGSGTTFVFSDYLTTVSAAWRERVGKGQALRWPTGLGAKGNEGVTGQLRLVPGAVGYVETAFARQLGLPTAALRNRSGDFVAPSIEATTRAAAGIELRVGAERDFRLSIVDSGQAAAYPLASFTFLLIPRHFEECGRARSLYRVIAWALTEGDDHARALHYAPLPEDVEQLVLATWRESVTCGSAREPLLPAS